VRHFATDTIELKSNQEIKSLIAEKMSRAIERPLHPELPAVLI
jgi:hypothetical protein